MAPGDTIPTVRPDGQEVRLAGRAGEDEAKTYQYLPFELAPGVERLEISYTWEPRFDTALDLGLWDQRGVGSVDGFRGWSGIRQGVRHEQHPPVWIESHEADRCYTPGPLDAGRYHLEIGVGAVAAGGASYEVTIRAYPEPLAGGGTRVSEPVDPAHVARAAPGWYFADLHQHGHHSHPRGPEWDELVAYSRAAGLDVLPVIEYVVGRHWEELGPIQDAHPDLLVYPGREVITYYGHVVVHGETPDLLEYRHGFDGVSLAQVQADVADAPDVMFQVAHPTIYPEDTFGGFCRGCFFALGDEIDWDLVDTFEVVTVGSWIDPPGIANPFVDTAIDLWHAKLRAGVRMTAVAGSDDKLGPSYGSCATAIGADELSRAGVRDALRAGRAYVAARGAHDSPRLALAVHHDGGDPATFGASIDAERAEVELSVQGAAGQRLRVLADGEEVEVVTLRRDDEILRRPVEHREGSGPLGTFWGFEVHDDRGLTALANPVFCCPER